MEESCEVCGEPATKYIGHKAVLPICSNPVCYVARIEEVNKLLKMMNYEQKEQELESD